MTKKKKKPAKVALKVTQAKEVTNKERFYYVGPNVVITSSFYPLLNNTGYVGLPDNIVEECKNNRHLERMFVKSDGIIHALVDLKNKNSIMSISYSEVEKGYK
jgi:hypothetical protein